MPVSRLVGCLSAVSLTLTLPLVAANRQHAVSVPASVTISGVVRDAATGAPVGGAIVRSGSSRSSNNGTLSDGKYTLTLPGGRPTLISAEHFAYETSTVVVTPTNGMTLDFNLSQPRPAVTVKLTNGETHVLDLASSKFAYLVPFSGYAQFDNANLCKPDGTSIAPTKNDFSRIVGPATSVNFSGCCTIGPVVTATAELKSGEKTPVYFNDSCFGYEVDFLGRERATGQPVFFNFLNIAEIDFP